MTTTETTMTQSAIDRFGLTVYAEVETDGQEWTVYGDGHGTYAVLTKDLAKGGDDYSLWCAGTTAAGDRTLCARIAALAGLTGIRAAGSDEWIPAATDEEVEL